MEIEFYNILKSGNYDKMRATSSTFNDRRRIVVYNPFAKELWMLNGSSLDSEILRLTDYAMNKLKKDLKVRHRVKVVKPDEAQSQFNRLLNLAKNPELAEEDAEKGKKAKKTTKKATKKAAKKATKKPAKKVSKKPTKKVTKKTAKKIVEKEIEMVPPKPKRKPLPTVVPSTIPKVKLPSPSTKSTMGIAKGDLHDDEEPVQMVEEFQIAYYEASGGAKLLIEELEESITEGAGYDKLVDHIQLINELVKSKSSNNEAKVKLEKSITSLTNALFPKKKKPVKKVTKKVAKKPAKKKTKKVTKKTTKKKKKTAKK
ncbi:MAG: hypothetical protein ACXAC2_13300 [Candidatus Kariarchaeaceae archaeon]|jgi:hypothetical protein